MLYVRLMGGLGNQMFQYAFAKAFEIKNQTEVGLDLSFLKNKKFHTQNTPRNYELGIFKITIPLINHSPIPMIDFLNRYLRKISRLIMGHKIINEKSYLFNQSYFNQKYKLLAIGYFQSEKYFKDIANILRNDFCFNVELSTFTQEIAKKISTENAISLHIRRGDYLVQNYIECCSVEYYEKGIEYLKEHVKHATLYIFSDDIIWAKSNIRSDLPMTFLEHNQGDKSYEDLYLMSKCKHHIIANSSFSWWGAWLNPSPQKIVIAPKKWFSKPTQDEKDIIPESWITL